MAVGKVAFGNLLAFAVVLVEGVPQPQVFAVSLRHTLKQGDGGGCIAAGFQIGDLYQVEQVVVRVEQQLLIEYTSGCFKLAGGAEGAGVFGAGVLVQRVVRI